MESIRNLFGLAVLVVFCLCGTCLAFSGAGSGTEGDPYVITNVEQLQEMADDLTAYYVLGNDIDASDTVNWNSGAGFEPVGSNPAAGGVAFVGVLDGQGHTINSPYINRPSDEIIGLFGYIANPAEVKNVGVVEANVTGYRNVGPLLG